MIRRRAVVILPLAAMLVLAARSEAQSRAVWWGDLEPGPYTVGHRVLYQLDHSRVWQVGPASVRAEEFSRPVRISVWYPAEPAIGAGVMTYGEFVYDEPPDPYFARLNDMLVPRFVEILELGMPSQLSVESVFALPVPFVKNAAPVSGIFPLVIYSPGGGATLPDNTMLAAYLASHGFVVGSVPHMPPAAARLEQNYQTSVEASARDVEFAVGVLGSFPNVDRRRLAVTGFSRGGIVALRVAARNANVDAVVGLDPSYAFAADFQRVTGSSAIDAYAFRIPMMTLFRGDADLSRGEWGFVLDSLRYSDRYVGRVNSVIHADFAEIRSMLYPAAFRASDLDPSLADAHRGYLAATRHVLDFLKRNLSEEADRVNDVASNLVEMSLLEAADIPTERELVDLVATEGYERASRRIREAIGRYPDLVVLRQDELISMGHEVRGSHADIAADVFRLVLEAYPESARAYEGLATIYVANGDSDRLVWAYERLLEVLPDDSSLTGAQKERYRRSVEPMLRLLRL